jgi:uncharacterized protein (TIGR00290 family)
MHGVRRSLLERQAASLGFALEKVSISKDISSEEYESRMREVLVRYAASGVSSVVFGDIFLEEIRNYREENLSKIGMRGIFPLWKRDTSRLAAAFIACGFRALITCVDSQVLDRRFVGRDFDERFLSELPGTVDPCGERGEFHSFVYDGPLFRERISYAKGDVVLREERFYYCDLIPIAAGCLPRAPAESLTHVA